MTGSEVPAGASTSVVVKAVMPRIEKALIANRSSSEATPRSWQCSIKLTPLLLDFNPHAVRAAVEERRPEQPDALRTVPKGLGVQVEVPFSTAPPELIS